MASFKMTFKGAGIIQEFEYICLTCKHECIIEQKRSDDMSHRECPECSTKKKKVFMLRHITKAPSLDADFHYRCHSSNIV